MGGMIEGADDFDGPDTIGGRRGKGNDLVDDKPPERALAIRFRGQLLNRLLTLSGTANRQPDAVVMDALRVYEFLVQESLLGTEFFQKQRGAELEPLKVFGDPEEEVHV